MVLAYPVRTDDLSNEIDRFGKRENCLDRHGGLPIDMTVNGEKTSYFYASTETLEEKFLESVTCDGKEKPAQKSLRRR